MDSTNFKSQPTGGTPIVINLCQHSQVVKPKTKSKLEEEKRFWNVNFFAVSLNNLATHTADFRDAHFIFISLLGSRGEI